MAALGWRVANWAVTVVGPVIESEHVPVPEQAPCQPVKRAPFAAFATSAIGLAGSVSVQVAAQSIPAPVIVP